ncbi:hypothetical protein BN1183_AT_00030 [Pantoea ananatis]|nr:hypothetical protein BN1183_AT_00030 [Pantoea ananatis]
MACSEVAYAFLGGLFAALLQRGQQLEGMGGRLACTPIITAMLKYQCLLLAQSDYA